MSTKPKHFHHQWGPWAIGNRGFGGKPMPPFVSTGFKKYPVADCTLDVTVQDKTERMTATRILAGGIIAGPAGMILGGMARKDITKGTVTLTVNGQQIQTVEFKAADLDKVERFVQTLADAQAATE